jgi:surface protein
MKKNIIKKKTKYILYSLLFLALIFSCSKNELSGSNDISSFIINDVRGIIEGNTIRIELLASTNVTNLKPVVIHTGESISPESGTAQDFTNPVIYTVTAENGSTKDYTVDLILKEIVLEAMTLETSEPSIQLGSSVQLSLGFTPQDTTQQHVIFSSSDGNLATVDGNGLVTAIALGEVTITATSATNPEISSSIVLQLLDLTSFVTTWSGQQITIPTNDNVNYNVDWNNDGIVDQSGIKGSITHTFDTAGEHTIRISGTFTAITFGKLSEVEAAKIININQWGTSVWQTMNQAFLNCKNLQVSASDVPNLSNVFIAEDMFRGASIANPDTSNWNMGNLNNIVGMFRDAKAANPNVSNWNTSNVTNMQNIFQGTTVANPDVSNWDTRKVTNMQQMFQSAKAANPNVSNWDTSKVIIMLRMFFDTTMANPDVSNWDTGKVSNMSGMFLNAKAANPDVSNWNISSVSDMQEMFSGSSANPDLSNWNISNVANMNNFLNISAISKENYERALIRFLKHNSLEGLVLPKNINLGKVPVASCSLEAINAKNDLLNKGWTIIEQGSCND